MYRARCQDCTMVLQSFAKAWRYAALLHRTLGCVFLANLIAVGCVTSTGDGMPSFAKTGAMSISQSCEMYYFDHGQYPPESFEALLTNQANAMVRDRYCAKSPSSNL